MIAPYDVVTEELLERIASRFRLERFRAVTCHQRLPPDCDLLKGVIQPDILVLEKRKSVRMITVETARTLRPSATNRWRYYEAVGVPHFVYVPEGLRSETWSLGVAASLSLTVVEYAR